jgi:hypothetical protein
MLWESLSFILYFSLLPPSFFKQYWLVSLFHYSISTYLSIWLWCVLWFSLLVEEWLCQSPHWDLTRSSSGYFLFFYIIQCVLCLPIIPFFWNNVKSESCYLSVEIFFKIFLPPVTQVTLALWIKMTPVGLRCLWYFTLAQVYYQILVLNYCFLMPSSLCVAQTPRHCLRPVIGSRMSLNL